MSFDKNYPNRKDWRKPYHKSKGFDNSCRPHGSCPWCEGNRKYSDIKKRTAADNQLDEFKKARIV